MIGNWLFTDVNGPERDNVALVLGTFFQYANGGENTPRCFCETLVINSIFESLSKTLLK